MFNLDLYLTVTRNTRASMLLLSRTELQVYTTVEQLQMVRKLACVCVCVRPENMRGFIVPHVNEVHFRIHPKSIRCFLSVTPSQSVLIHWINFICLLHKYTFPLVNIFSFQDLEVCHFFHSLQLEYILLCFSINVSYYYYIHKQIFTASLTFWKLWRFL